MRSTQQRQKFPSTDPKKTVTILKCFLCNQLFYAQNLFDVHMKQHQSKINRSIPEEIQRRTMDSFRNKQKITNNNKTTLLPVQGNSITNSNKKQMVKSKRDVLSSTLKEPKRSMQINQINKQERQWVAEDARKLENQNVEDLLQQSTALMERISFLTQYPLQQDVKQQQYDKNQTLLQRDLVVKNINESQFQRSISCQLKQTGKINNSNIQYLLLRTNFCRHDWKSYQQQFEFLQQLNDQFENQSNIRKLQGKILQKFVQDVKKEIQYTNYQYQSKQTGMRFCCDCFVQIHQFDDFQSRKCGHHYHKSCSIENPKCCQ